MDQANVKLIDDSSQSKKKVGHQIRDSSYINVSNDTETVASSSPLAARKVAESGERPYNMSFLVFLVTVATIGGFLFGYDTSVIGGAQLYFKNDWPDITTF